MEEIQIVALAADWPRIRADPRFVELMRIARVANSLSLAYRALVLPERDQSPQARRERFAGLFYAAALLKEGLHTAQSLGRWYRELPQYQDGFAELFRDPAVESLQSGLLDRIRDELVFHFDRDAIALGLSRLTSGEMVIGTFPLSGATAMTTYFDLADDAVLGYLFGRAPTDDEYLQQLGEFMEGIRALFSRYVIAAHRLVAAGLLALGCRKRKAIRPDSPSDDSA